MRSVYRCYDVAARLIYVGCAIDVDNRVHVQHRIHSWWYPQVTRVEAEHYEDDRRAASREWEVIGAESPRWNIQGKPRTTPTEIRDLITALERHENGHLPHNRMRVERYRRELERKQAEALRWIEEGAA